MFNNKEGKFRLATQAILGTVEACTGCYLYAECQDDSWRLLGSFQQIVLIVTQGNKDKVPITCHFRGKVMPNCAIKRFYSSKTSEM